MTDERLVEIGAHVLGLQDNKDYYEQGLAEECAAIERELVDEVLRLRAEVERLREWAAFAMREFDALRVAYNNIAQKPPPSLGSHVPGSCSVLVRGRMLLGQMPATPVGEPAEGEDE